MPEGMSWKRCSAALLLVTISTLPARGGGSGKIEGTVIFRGEARQGVAIEVYLEARKEEGGGVPFATSETGEGGRFTLTLPSGEYWLWAREPPPEFGPPGVSEYHRNPVRLEAGDRLDLEPLELQAAGAREMTRIPENTGISGRVLFSGEPVEEAVVMAYAEGRERLTGPGYVALMASDGEGRFTIDLAPGRYQVVARRRQGGEMMGLLREGDLSVEYEGNPVAVLEGEYTNLGPLTLHRLDREKLAGQAALYYESASSTLLGGRVIGPDGKPLKGQFVFAYRDQGMIGRPDFITTSVEDGSFVMNLPAGGTYYVGARSRYGGPRQPGEMIGRLDGSPDSSVKVPEGKQVKGLTIHMQEAW